ncbi:MAG: site-2 protease family protein [Phycisphaerales bacterium]|jgi:regulator of sigma E protease
MSEKKILDKRARLILLATIFIAMVILIVRNINAFGNVLLVLLGFGTVILVHEFGHFIVAKLSDIKVEAFSIGFPPTFLGIRRTMEGYRIRVLPTFFKKEKDEGQESEDGKSEEEKDEPDEGSICFTVGKKGKENETEYRLGLIPIGGFVKMLGQEDAGTVEATDDPRSYANKPAGVRAAVLAAGVGCNVISAVIIFMIAFLVGINLPPAIVGGVAPGSPAERAGIEAGDEIIMIDGKSKDLDFTNISIAAALSGKDEEVPLRVRHEDGTEEDFTLVAEKLPGEPLRAFGIAMPESLTIGKLTEEDSNDLYSKTGLIAGDRIESVDGMEVRSYWGLEKAVRNILTPTATLSIERDGDEKELIELQTQLDWEFADSYFIESESELYHIYSMVPRLRITNLMEKLAVSGDNANSLQSEDVILAVGDVVNPTYLQMRETIEEFEDKELPIKVLRAQADGSEEELTITVTPSKKEGSDRVTIGAPLGLDAGHPVVAKTINTEGGPPKLEIPNGAEITAVDGTPVSSFYDIVREIRKYEGDRITIDYRIREEQVAGYVVLDVKAGKDSITVQSQCTDLLTLPLEKVKRLYKASGPINAVGMGYRKTVMFIAQTYVTLRRLLSGLVSPRNLMGPVGILSFSYRIVAEEPFIYYVYFMGLISATIAVFNFLPLPPLDGGLVVLLLVERIKGSALSERVQGAIAYAGWVLILALILYVTFNDILRTFFGYRL